MKKTAVILFLVFLCCFAAAAKTGFLFSVGPEVGAEGLAIDNTSGLMKYNGGQIKLGVFLDPMFSVYAGMAMNAADYMSAYSAYAAFPGGYSASVSAGLGLYLNGLDLLADVGFRVFNIGKDTKNRFLLYSFGFTPQFSLVSGQGHAFKICLPFTYAFSKNAKFFSTGVSFVYEYGVKK